MKTILGLMWLLASVQAQAAIFICKDQAGNISYQDKPCTSRMIGQLNNVPDAPIEDQLRVQASIQAANSQYQARMAQREQERLQALEHERLQLALAIENRKLALLEQQAQAPQPSLIVLNNVPARAGWRHASGLQRHPSHHAKNAIQRDRNRSFRSRVRLVVKDEK